jgi:hypothetical protein
MTEQTSAPDEYAPVIADDAACPPPLPRAARALADALEADRRAFLAEWGPLWRDLAWNAPRPGTRLGWTKVVQLIALARDVAARGVPGGYAEFGVWRGGALCFVGAAWSAPADRGRPMLGFDSFRGLPDAAPEKDGGVVRPGMFDDTSVEIARETLARHGLDQRVELVPGWFDQTIGRIDGERLALLHIDCDLYEGTRLVLERAWGRVSPGGVMVVDDYRCPDTPGVTIAVEEFFASRPERVEMAPGLAASCIVRKAAL